MTILTKNTDQLRRVVDEHIAADAVVQGEYWDSDKERGGFIGCLAHSDDPSISEMVYGLPVMLQRIAENIFERLPATSARQFFAALPEAVACDGKDLSKVGWRFLAAELRSLPPQPPEIQAVIDPVIAGMDLLADGDVWSRVAARAAWSAAACAAEDAADATTEVATWAAFKAAAKAAEAGGWAAAWVAAVCAAEVAAQTTNAAEVSAWAIDVYAAAEATKAAAKATATATWAAAIAAARATDWAADCAGDGLAARLSTRRRQRDTLLRLVQVAPVVEFDSHGNATSTTAP